MANSTFTWTKNLYFSINHIFLFFQELSSRTTPQCTSTINPEYLSSCHIYETYPEEIYKDGQTFFSQRSEFITRPDSEDEDKSKKKRRRRRRYYSVRGITLFGNICATQIFEVRQLYEFAIPMSILRHFLYKQSK